MMLVQTVMSCEEVASLITEFEEGTLTGVRWLRFRTHLFLCAKCVGYLEQMRKTTAFLGALPPEDISDSLRTELADQFRLWSESSERGKLDE